MIDAAPTIGAARSVAASHHCRRDFLFRGAQFLKGEAFSPAVLDVPAWQVRNLERTHIAAGPASDRLQIEAMERRERPEKSVAEAKARVKSIAPTSEPTIEPESTRTRASGRGGRAAR